MRTRTRASAMILAAVVGSSICTPSIWAQALPDNTVRITDGVYSYGTGDDYNSMFVVTGEGVIAFESVSSVHATGFLQAIREVTDQPVRYLLNSHNHWDHASGGQVFKDAGATLVAHAEAYAWIEANTGLDQVVPDESWTGSRKDITVGFRDPDLPAVQALVYIATERNPNYLGPAVDAEIAAQIRNAHGPSGSNSEYALELAAALRNIEAEDDHVFAIADLLVASA